MATSQRGRKLNPYRQLRSALGVKGIRQSVVTTNNPSTIDQNQMLTVRFPKTVIHCTDRHSLHRPPFIAQTAIHCKDRHSLHRPPFIAHTAIHCTHRHSFEECLCENDVIPREEKDNVEKRLAESKHAKLIIKTEQPAAYVVVNWHIAQHKVSMVLIYYLCVM